MEQESPMKQNESTHSNSDLEESMTWATGKTRVMHLLGSSTSDYYYTISLLYAQACMNAASADSQTMSEFDFMFAVVHPPADGSTQPTWSFPTDLTEEAMSTSKQCSHVTGIQKLGRLAPDVV